jgi:hypothetical protein
MDKLTIKTPKLNVVFTGVDRVYRKEIQVRPGESVEVLRPIKGQVFICLRLPPLLSLGWCSNFVGSESGPIQSVKLL